MLKIDQILRRETKKPAESIWNNFIFPVEDYPVTEGNVEIKSEEILENF